jgi:hypothetical protein
MTSSWVDDSPATVPPGAYVFNETRGNGMLADSDTPGPLGESKSNEVAIEDILGDLNKAESRKGDIDDVEPSDCNIWRQCASFHLMNSA